jgi:hypothetical protein
MPNIIIIVINLITYIIPLKHNSSIQLPLSTTCSDVKMFLLLLPLLPLVHTRDITFPPSSGYASNQVLLNGYTDPDISAPKFAGLETFANLPYVHCLGNEEVEGFDVAVLGAPFDTVSLCVFCFVLCVIWVVILVRAWIDWWEYWCSFRACVTFDYLAVRSCLVDQVITDGYTACCEVHRMCPWSAMCKLKFGSRCVDDGSGYHFRRPDIRVLHRNARRGKRMHDSDHRVIFVATQIETDTC